MKHRHLTYADDTPVERLPSAAVVDILQRGDLNDWRPIATRVAIEPHGELADRVLRLLSAYRMYGTSTLWRTWIDRCRARHEATLRARPAVDLAALRTQRGLTQAALAARIGISQSDLSKLERRTDVKVSTLRTYATALGYALFLECCDDTGCRRVELRDPGSSDQSRTVVTVA